MTGGTARLNNVTLAFNASSGLGGPFFADTGSLIEFSNSLFSENDSEIDNCGNATSLGYNLFQIGICQPVASDIIDEPLIGSLADNGGPTQTHALDPISPAIDAANPGQLVIELASALSNAQLSFNGAAEQAAATWFPSAASSLLAVSSQQHLMRDHLTSMEVFPPSSVSRLPTLKPDLDGEPSGDGFTFAIAANQNVLGEPVAGSAWRLHLDHSGQFPWSSIHIPIVVMSAPTLSELMSEGSVTADCDLGRAGCDTGQLR